MKAPKAGHVGLIGSSARLVYAALAETYDSFHKPTLSRGISWRHQGLCTAADCVLESGLMVSIRDRSRCSGWTSGVGARQEGARDVGGGSGALLAGPFRR